MFLRPIVPPLHVLLAPGLFGLVAACAFHTHGTSEGTTSAGTTTSGTTSATASGTTSGTTTGSTTGAGAGGSGGSGTSSTSGSGGTGGSGATGGTGGAPVVCGDGHVDPSEACDDGNANGSDGCSPGCTVELGYTCSGDPSVCNAIPPQVVSVTPNMTIKDPNHNYDGSLGTMQCATVTLVDEGYPFIQQVVLTVGIDHTWVGDLVLKLVSPQGTISTMMSRPGAAESSDAYDEVSGDSSQLTATSSIIFRDDATDDAETMGNTIDGGFVCQDDGRCVYHPNPDTGPGNGLADFQGESPAGNWQVCLADGDDNDGGVLKLVTLLVLAWPLDP